MAKITKTTKKVTRTVTEDVPVYVLELTKEQLVALGALSYRHEHLAGGTFYRQLPRELQSAAEDAVISNTMPVTLHTTQTGVDWSA